MTENELAKTVVDLCVKIHKTLGPGLLESAYEECLTYELKKQGLQVQRQVSVPLIYDGVELGEGFRADIIVDGKLILELKSVGEIQQVNYSRLLTYLRLTGLKSGLLINFGQSRVSEVSIELSMDYKAVTTVRMALRSSRRLRLSCAPVGAQASRVRRSLCAE